MNKETDKIKWLEWGKESFEKAKKEDKPILLDLTAVWCHWCHVMDTNSYSNDEIAKIINECFVPIKVYIDKRPDIRERYNMGGFPSTVFLDNGGQIITGDTYVPPERFKFMLETVKSSYKNKKDFVKNKQEQKNDADIFSGSKAEINEEIIKATLMAAEDSFDRFYGGFGVQPKFPSSDVLDLLFFQYQKTKDKKYIEMAIKTLDGMHDGIYDKVYSGFFRYSAAQDWKMPHFEKMLDTNAGLLRNYAVAYNITKNEKYRKIAMDTLGYLNKFLSDQKNGGFYGSQDADEEFYSLGAEERNKRNHPHIDNAIYVDWNAMMISSYIKAGAILNDNKAIEFGIKTSDFILDKFYDSKSGLSHFLDKELNVNGLLADNIYFLNAIIDAYFASQNQMYLKKINEISGFILKNFYDETSSGFFDKVIKEEDLGELKQRDKHFLDNSFSAIVFLRVYFLTKEEKYKEAAKKTLLHFSNSCFNFGYFAAMYAMAVGMLLEDVIKVDIVGRKDMINVCIASNNPRVFVSFIDKHNNKSSNKDMPMAEGAYVCKGALCKGPTTDNNKLEEELAN